MIGQWTIRNYLSKNGILHVWKVRIWSLCDCKVWILGVTMSYWTEKWNSFTFYRQTKWENIEQINFNFFYIFNDNKTIWHTLLAKSLAMAEVRSSICPTASLSAVRLVWSWALFPVSPEAHSFSRLRSCSKPSSWGCRAPRWPPRCSNIGCTVSHWNRTRRTWIDRYNRSMFVCSGGASYLKPSYIIRQLFWKTQEKHVNQTQED